MEFLEEQGRTLVQEVHFPLQYSKYRNICITDGLARRPSKLWLLLSSTSNRLNPIPRIAIDIAADPSRSEIDLSQSNRSLKIGRLNFYSW